MVLYVSSQPNSLCSNFWSNMYKCITIFQSFNIIKNSSLYDLLQSIDNTMFHNPFVDQYRFHYSNPSVNENDETLDPYVTINVDDDVDNDIIPLIYEFKDAFESIFVVSHK